MKQFHFLILTLFFFMTHIVMSAVFIHADMPQSCSHETENIAANTLPHTDFDGKEKDSILSCLSCNHCFHFANQQDVLTIFQQETALFEQAQNKQLISTYLSTPKRPPRV